MPTYSCYAPAGLLDAARKSAIAAEITRIHNAVTGAASFFAQVRYLHIVPQLIRDPERYTRKNTSCARSSATAVLCAIRYIKLSMGRRYFCTRYSKADSSPAFTRSMIWASLNPSLGGSPAIFAPA